MALLDGQFYDLLNGKKGDGAFVLEMESPIINPNDEPRIQPSLYKTSLIRLYAKPLTCFLHLACFIQSMLLANSLRIVG